MLLLMVFWNFVSPVNVMLPNAIYRILDSTRTEYIIWKYIVAENRNVLFEFTISSLKYVYILFDRDAALMRMPQKSRTNRAGWSRCPSSFWPGECTQQDVALCIGWGFADVCWVYGALWSTMTHSIVREISLHVNRTDIYDVIKLCGSCCIVHRRLHVTCHDFRVADIFT